ncbi:JAB domain-containing protein [Planctomycetota bacterium]
MKDTPRKPAIYQFEIIRHTVHEPGKAIHTPEDMKKHFSFMEAYDREHVLRVDLNNAHESLGYETVCIGTDNMSMVGPKEVFRGALLSGASCIILVHNHPSGQVKPSSEDHQIAKKLKCLGVDLDLQLLDFVIIGRNGNYYSLAENDLL